MIHIFTCTSHLKEELPPYYQPWMDITLQIPELVHSHELRPYINKVSGDNILTRMMFMKPSFSFVTNFVQMPLLSSKFLQKHRELRLAHLALSMMTMGYVWQEGDNDTVEVSVFVIVFFMFSN